MLCLQHDYKSFSPDTEPDTVDWESAPAIQEPNVTSAICEPCSDAAISSSDGTIPVKGFAYRWFCDPSSDCCFPRAGLVEACKSAPSYWQGLCREFWSCPSAPLAGCHISGLQTCGGGALCVVVPCFQDVYCAHAPALFNAGCLKQCFCDKEILSSSMYSLPSGYLGCIHTATLACRTTPEICLHSTS